MSRWPQTNSVVLHSARGNHASCVFGYCAPSDRDRDAWDWEIISVTAYDRITDEPVDLLPMIKRLPVAMRNLNDRIIDRIEDLRWPL